MYTHRTVRFTLHAVVLVLALAVAVAPISGAMCEASCQRPVQGSAVPECHKAMANGSGTVLSSSDRGCNHAHTAEAASSLKRIVPTGLVVSNAVRVVSSNDVISVAPHATHGPLSALRVPRTIALRI
jgi:hypothetical protein